MIKVELMSYHYLDLASWLYEHVYLFHIQFRESNYTRTCISCLAPIFTRFNIQIVGRFGRSRDFLYDPTHFGHLTLVLIFELVLALEAKFQM